MDLALLMEELKPICRFDPNQPQKYRDSNLLRSALERAIPGMKEIRNEELEMRN